MSPVNMGLISVVSNDRWLIFPAHFELLDPILITLTLPTR